MTPYTPDTTASTYGSGGKHDLLIVMVCNNHNPPFYSEVKPIEVELS